MMFCGFCLSLTLLVLSDCLVSGHDLNILNLSGDCRSCCLVSCHQHAKPSTECIFVSNPTAFSLIFNVDKKSYMFHTNLIIFDPLLGLHIDTGVLFPFP